MAKKKTKKLKNSIPRRLVVFGDLHGDIEALRESLTHSALTDKSLNWKAKNTTLIQMGDVIDRGEHGLEIYNLLEKLQEQAKNFKSKVIRLLGNHELEILKGSYFLTNIGTDKILNFYEKLSNDVMNGKITASFHTQGYLFSHAGISDNLLETFTKKLAPKKPSAANITNAVNTALIEAVNKKKFSHPIFFISPKRGGDDKYGGIFWEDLRDLMPSKHKHSFTQVVGHTPVNKVTVSGDGKVIAVDVGLCKTYGSRRQYLVIENKKIKPVNFKKG